MFPLVHANPNRIYSYTLYVKFESNTVSNAPTVIFEDWVAKLYM